MILTLIVYVHQIIIGMDNHVPFPPVLGAKFGKELNVFAQLEKTLMIQCVLSV